ncbi:MAG: AAA family ATPase, partial [Leptolyngbyaceae cyanobacterium RU_5_1]|nr:AAA family ATPase [Leptolyngbyaceae cyanobacterium RU_5_1]
MIPVQLTLKNFLSYREATLNFRGLHTACICGANGAGKSSLLEAIAWVIWGESRTSTEDDVIHVGAADAQVDFIFTSQHCTYRIIRNRQRGQGTALEFQVAQDVGSGWQTDKADVASSSVTKSAAFRSLTAKSVRATQQLIIEHLKLDYETFVNSAYLRQGRADEFMLKRPGERKQILADLLKLDQYDDLAERAKDQVRQLKGQIELMERNLESIQEQLQQQDAIAQEQAALETTLAEMQHQQTVDSEQLHALQSTQHQRQVWHQQLTWHQQQQRVLHQDCQRLQQEVSAAQHQQHELEGLLQQERAIAAGYAHFQTLQAQEEQLSNRFKTAQHLQAQRQHYQQQQHQTIAELQRQLQHLQAQLEALQQQEQDIQQTLNKAPTVEHGLKELHQARTHLAQLDQLQLQAAPLLQRRQQLQSQLDRNHTRLTTRLEELRASVRQLQLQQERQPQLQQAVLDVSDRIAALERQRSYQQQVREKGLERRSFMERLQAHQRDYETQLADVEQKIQLLKQGIVGQEDGEMGRWGDGEMGRWGDGEMGR